MFCRSILTTLLIVGLVPSSDAWALPHSLTTAFSLYTSPCPQRSQSLRSSIFDRTYKRPTNIRLHATKPPPSRVSVQSTAVDTAVDESTLASTKVEQAAPHEDGPIQNNHFFVQKIINGAILAFSFGFAAYTILNIDHGMTRGWTQPEIAMRISIDNWSSYETSLAEKPVYTKTLINVIIYLLGDWMSQTIFQKKNILDFDASRTLRNGFIGMCFGPLVHEYYQFSDYILPVEGGILNRVEKILMDQTLYLTIKCSIYIAAIGLLQGDSWPTVKESVKGRIGGVVVTAWKFWPLVHCITYSVIPARHRILWVNVVDLVWNAILAGMSNQKDQPDEATIEPVEQVLKQEAALMNTAANETAVAVGLEEAVTVLEEAVGDPFLLRQETISSAFGTNSTTLFTAELEDEAIEILTTGNSTHAVSA